ncbi:hypothetical protein CPC735_038710 [Coccidioides posadasii C735 delta SOWgp]|uniref:Uncharacterized protein n=1 Tax=Coccidioides posadasii (strain C735) TaxID=222929 RepID=C5P2R9_COCP7|nr:hypothetical protein CPC735_038710 [Coccidioides posadasii C735 delta SOWgp]EER28607.1 hypothetical protein CPC735_038710 [Coccidioides posadasii C735 delta SOWgp]|eukprot:XP_003070752.1 hypothetical protein CPC735_038710 [Coccidioides posadasii C735 delta SOWgp]
MDDYIPAPDPRSLLPSLLACLPAGFASPRPPPVLLPLLSPILRQRVQLFSSVSPSSADSWIRLLCWNASRGEQIERIIGGASFEPHPVSGEIEIPDDIKTRYKRVDVETLRAQFPLPDYNLAPIYVWCPGDQEGGGPGWRVAEVLPLDSLQDEGHTWFGSIGEANASLQDRVLDEALKGTWDALRPYNDNNEGEGEGDGDGDGDEDDDYWAQYDDNLGRTPVRIQTPSRDNSRIKQLRDTSDDSYYNRYDEVQPAMDNDDPSVDRNEVGDSSLNGDAVASVLRQQIERIAHQNGRSRTPPAVSDFAVSLSHPRPESASSQGSDAILRLERTAENQSMAEMGVREYISSNFRNLYLLARSTGIPREEFGNLVRKELDRLEYTGFERTTTL